MNRVIERWAPLWGTFDKIRNSHSIIEKCENIERATHRSNARKMLVTFTFHWKVRPCTVLDVYQRFGKSPYLFLQVVKSADDKTKAFTI
jgi:hypothetical protein